MKCPLCSRTKLGDNMIPEHLSYDAIKKTVHENLNFVLFCGNLGDPLMHPDCDKIFDLFDESIAMQINTNGTIRDSSWYTKMAQRKNLIMEFSIDGLEDTNNIYRIDAEWNKIMENAQAFIDAGGTARWSFIFFKHNEHQFADVKNLARKMGFKMFKTKISQRTSTLDLNTNLIHPNHEIPVEKEIECQAYLNDSIFINATGVVDLCTWSQPLKFERNLNDATFNDIMKNIYNADTELQHMWMCRENRKCNLNCGTKAGGTIKNIFLEF